MVTLKQINKIYRSTGDDVHALKDLNLTFGEGDNIVVIGKSGSGKSTLLNIISGIDRPTSGEIIVGAEDYFSHLLLF